MTINANGHDGSGPKVGELSFLDQELPMELSDSTCHVHVHVHGVSPANSAPVKEHEMQQVLLRDWGWNDQE